MKDILLKALKIFLIFMLIALAILMVFVLVQIRNWPLWLGFFILLGLIGLVIALILLRKIWLKRKEKLFVQTIIDQDEVHLKSLVQKDKDQLKQLQDRWKESIETLRHSNLRKYGNPLYVLPWYLVIGESGSGKTTAIQSARLSSPFTEVNQISGISGTRNCDWWFFEQAVIIDTAGRYTIPIDQSKDKEEWKRFIGLLAKYRKREPLNGLIVTIAANKLIEAGPEALKEDGRIVRRRINELISVLGAKPPIYILVTKCDLIQGMTQFCDQLPDKALDQAMGFINQDLSTDVVGFLTRSINTLVDRLRDFRLMLLHKSEVPSPDPGLLLFPEELKNIENGLKSFIRKAFQENPYQETQILRGIFFSSGRQEGSPFSHFLNALGLIEEKDVLAGTNKGLFLHDFFARIIPRDRHLFAPTRMSIEWKRLTKSLGLTSWVAIGIALCGFLSLAFVMNMNTLNEFSDRFSKLELQGEIFSDVIRMDDYRKEILKMEARNQNWWIPRFYLKESKNIELKIKEEYVKQFQEGFLSPLNKQMEEQMAQMSKATPRNLIGLYVSHLVKRINLLEKWLETRDINAILTVPRPNYEPLILASDKELIPKIKKINDDFGNLYLYYLIWNHPDGIKDELDLIQPLLEYILTSKVAGLRWLVPWANAQEKLSYVTLDNFWEGSLQVKDAAKVAPAFTKKGKEMIDSFMSDIESALSGPRAPTIAKQKMEFYDWYQKAYIDEWYHFGSIFDKGIKTLNGRQEWLQMAAKMPADQVPFFDLLDKMFIELEPLNNEESMPSWMELLYDFQIIKERAAEQSAPEDKGFIERTTQSLSRIGKEATDPRREKLEARAAKAYVDYSKALKAYVDYSKALEDIAMRCKSKISAYQTASQVYNDPITNQTPFHSANKAVFDLKKALGTGRKGQEMLWGLMTGPLDYLWTIVRRETACYLQDEWNETVIRKTEGTSSDAAAVFLVLSKDGEANRFKDNIANPFIALKQTNDYFARVVLGEKIPFKEDFFSFINQGSIVPNIAGKSFTVRIEGKPTSANLGARGRPESTRLELKCDDGSQGPLNNYNHPCEKTFIWSPDTCQEISLEIRIEGGIELTKNYSGYNAFPRFLEDFQKGGKRRFHYNEFHEYASTLSELNIRYIDVVYKFTRQHREVLSLLKVPPRVPKVIVLCWEK
jgi:type VI secretion system protein ImpL